MRDKRLNNQLASVLRLSMEEQVESFDNSNIILDEDGSTTSPLIPSTGQPIAEAQQSIIVEQNYQLSEVNNAIDQSDEDVETLESIQISLESSLTNSNTSVMSYEMFDITLNHIYRKYDIKSNNVIPSLESYSDSPVEHLEISLEKIRGSVGAVVEAAVQLLKKMWFITRKLIDNLFKFGGSIVKRADAISKYASAHPHDGKAIVKLHSAAKLEVKGKVPPKNQLIQLYLKACPNFDKLTHIIAVQITAISDMLDGLINGNISKADQVILDSVKGFKEAEYLLGSTLVFQNAKIESVAVTLPRIKKTYPLPKLVVETKGMDKRGDDSDVYKIEALSTDEIVSITTVMINAVKTLERVKKTYDNKDLDRRINLLVDVDKKLSGRKDKKAITLRAANKAVSKALRLLLSFNNKYITYMMNVHKAVLDYCAQSAKSKTTNAKANTDG